MDAAPVEIITDLAVMPSLRAHRDELLRGLEVRQHLARLRQVRLAQASAQIESRFIEGLGARTMTIEKDLYYAKILRYGSGCWHDKGFRRDMLKRHPEFAVHSRSATTTLRVQGLKGSGKQESRNSRRTETRAHEGRARHVTQGEPAQPLRDLSGHETASASLVLPPSYR